MIVSNQQFSPRDNFSLQGTIGDTFGCNNFVCVCTRTIGIYKEDKDATKHPSVSRAATTTQIYSDVNSAKVEKLP